MRAILLGLALMGANCAAVRPAPEALPGRPTTASGRAFAEDLALLRAALGDLLVLGPAAGREGVLPPIDSEGQAAARSELEAWALQWESGRGGAWTTGPQTDDERLTAARARAWIQRGRYLWGPSGESGHPVFLRPVFLDSVWDRGWMALHFTPPRPEDLTRFAEEAAAAMSVASPSAAEWARARLDRFPPRAAALLRPYAEALSTTSTSAPLDLARALQAQAGANAAPDLAAVRANARAGVARARQRLYSRALEVLPTGPDGVDERIAAAFKVARTRRVAPESTRVEEALLAALPGVSTSTSSASSLDSGDPVARALALQSRIRSRLEGDVVLGIPPNPVRVLVASTHLLEQLSDDAIWPAELRLFSEGIVLERRVRAWAELTLRSEGRIAAQNLLVEEGFHELEVANEVLAAAWETPGLFARLTYGEMLMSDVQGCRVPPSDCSR